MTITVITSTESADKNVETFNVHATFSVGDNFWVNDYCIL